MRTYVLGAGASYPIYPLGGVLFNAIDEHIQSCGPCFNRFDCQTDWPKLKEWLANNSNPLLRQAYCNGNIEQIFTVLDLAEGLISDSWGSMFLAAKKGMTQVKEAEAHHQLFATEIREYRHARSKLLWAVEDFFLQGNHDDAKDYSSDDWKNLKRFGALLDPGDIVITFNYDSTVERVLLDSGKWTPADGYGADLAFRKSEYDKTPVNPGRSAVKVLHLHGAAGWYATTTLAPIALDPLLLQGLGINYIDASLPDRPPNDRQILLHPSFLKEYGGQGTQNRIFQRLWKQAGNVLRSAETVTIIGYSLPPADAWTLLHTCCERGRTVVVNPDKSVLSNRYGDLLNAPVRPDPQAMDFGKWLDIEDQARNGSACT